MRAAHPNPAIPADRDTGNMPEMDMKNSVAAWPDKEDHELMLRVQEGSHHAFASLVERHSTRFYHLAFRYLRSRELAEDIVQDAFLMLWQKPFSWEAGRNNKFTTWFHRVVVNRCLDWLKKKKPLPLAEGFEMEDTRPAQDTLLQEFELQANLEQEIATLPERQQTALHLCFSEGLSNQQAADQMGMKLKALQSLIMRAKTTLRTRMRDLYGEEL